MPFWIIIPKHLLWSVNLYVNVAFWFVSFSHKKNFIGFSGKISGSIFNGRVSTYDIIMFFVENVKHQEFQIMQITSEYKANFLHLWCTSTECCFLSNLFLAGDGPNVAEADLGLLQHSTFVPFQKLLFCFFFDMISSSLSISVVKSF